jgi:hypothetical protein
VESKKVPRDIYALLALYNFAAVNGNDLLHHIIDPADQLNMLDDVKGNIENMLELIHSDTKHVAQELHIRHYISRGEYFMKTHDVVRTQDAYAEAERLFEDPDTNINNTVSAE